MMAIKLSDEDIEKIAQQLLLHLQQGPQATIEPLLNMKQLSETIGISYNTLYKKRLPFHRSGRKGRKLYKASEVIASMKR